MLGLKGDAEEAGRLAGNACADAHVGSADRKAADYGP